MLDDKLQETQTALEAEENKAKGEHRARLKLESALQDLEEKMDRENAVSCHVTSHANQNLSHDPRTCLTPPLPLPLASQRTGEGEA